MVYDTNRFSKMRLANINFETAPPHKKRTFQTKKRGKKRVIGCNSVNTCVIIQPCIKSGNKCNWDVNLLSPLLHGLPSNKCNIGIEKIFVRILLLWWLSTMIAHAILLSNANGGLGV